MSTYPTYKLGEVAEIILGQSPESKSYNTKGEGLPFFQGKSEFTDWFPIPNKWCTEPKKIAEPLDILLSVRAPVGPTNVAKEKCCIGRGLAAIRYPECYKYVLYYLRSVSKHIESKATGTTFSSISGDVIKNLPIPLSPLPTQHQIVSRIESLFAELDKAVEHLSTAQQQLKIYRQAVLNYWLNNDDGKWETVRLGEVAEAIDPEPSHRTPKIEKQGIPFISIKDCDYKTNTINFNTARLVSSSVLIEHKSRYTINEGDFIIGKIGTIGNPVNVVLPQDYALSANVVLIKATDKINAKFLYNLFRSVIIERQLLKGKKATTQAAFGIQKVRLIEIPLPPLSDQQRIVGEIESRLSQAEAAEARIAEALQKTEALRQSILKKAFSGELV